MPLNQIDINFNNLKTIILFSRKQTLILATMCGWILLFTKYLIVFAKSSGNGNGVGFGYFST